MPRFSHERPSLPKIESRRLTAVVTTVEISMYPFIETFRELVKEFISKLHDFSQLQVNAGPTSTVLIGDYDDIMTCLTEMIRWSYERHGQSVFVTKILPGYAPT